ncbi:MAG: hypothetical protein HS111_28985 [Kofleriaceae bacterium]|nr:hypothetical protein [Kofleriaceae bacterium]
MADAVVRGESAEHLLGAPDGAAAGSGGSGVQRKEGGAPGVDAPEIAAPRLIEFDDLELGDRQRRETTLWNPGDTEVILTKAELVLDRTQQQFQVREAPTRLVPTSSSAAARMGRLVLDFVPQGEGLRTDTLRLTVRRHGASGAERTVSIALAGRARAPGQPAHAEKVARERGEQAQRDEEAATAGREQARDARIERNMEDPRPAPAGRAEPFRARLDDMRDDVREIDAKRIEGINVIEREAETYRRRQPPLTPSAWDFVRDGAILALSFASAGLARNVAALLVPVGGHKPGPLGIGVGVADDNTRASGGNPSASRQLVQKAVEKALGKGMEAAIRHQTSNRPAAAPAADAPTSQPLSSDPTIAFSRRAAARSRSATAVATRLDGSHRARPGAGRHAPRRGRGAAPCSRSWTRRAPGPGP